MVVHGGLDVALLVPFPICYVFTVYGCSDETDKMRSVISVVRVTKVTIVK